MALPKTSRTSCPRCAVAAIDPKTGTCDVCGFKLDAPPASERSEGRADALGDLVARHLAHEFEIGEVIGRRDGSMVLRASDKKDPRPVVLKVVQRRTDDPDSEVRFRSTMDAHAHLDHPHLITVLRYGVTDSLLWYSMHDHGSTSLRAQLREQGHLDARGVRRIATQLVGALEYLHRRGIVHGAVKPENVLLDAQGWVRLVEPAFAPAATRRRTSGPHDAVPEPAPRPSWVAPEDVNRANRTPASDQFSLAALLFECASGEPPLEPGEQVSRFRPEVPAAMSNALARALDAQAAQRFPTCSDFLFALDQNAPAVVSAHRPSGRMSTEALLIHDWEPPEAAKSPRRTVSLVVGGLLLVLLGVAIPPLVRKFLESRTPPSMVSAPETAMLPSGPAANASPSAVRVVGDLAAPTTTPPPSSTRSVVPSAPSTPRTQPAPGAAAPPPAATSAVPVPASPAAATANAATGNLTVNASPWGQVFVDDRLIGNTPRADIELPAGQHTLRVSRAGFRTVTRTVQIRAGETLRITDIVLIPDTP
jgi:serine/threonine-protein kinase